MPETVLGKCLQDADRIEALGVIGVFRNIACGAKMNCKFLDGTAPWGNGTRTLNDKQFSLDHYPLKLLQLERTMNTEAGKAEARKRSATMRRMLEDLGDEIGEPYTEEHWAAQLR